MVSPEMLVALRMALGVQSINVTEINGIFQFSTPGRRNWVGMSKDMVEVMNKEDIGGKSYWWLVQQLRELPRI